MVNDDHPTKLSNLLGKIPGGTLTLGLVVVFVVFLFAVLSWSLAGDTGLTFASVVTSGVLSAALAVLYFQQTKLLQGQTSLRKQEINREVRRSHAEVLRQRIHALLGTDDLPRIIDPVDEVVNGSDDRLPSVTTTDVEPPGDVDMALDPSDEFWVIPPDLERDRYFRDLLENHAPNIDERIEKIERLYSDFAECRAQFKTEFEGEVTTGDGFLVEPDRHLSQWVFERIVRIERVPRRTWDGELDIVESAFESGGNLLANHNRIRFMEKDRGGRSIYVAIPNEGSIEDADTERVTERAIDAIQSTAGQDNIEENPYRTAENAATVLDSMDDEIRELRMDLIDLAGRQVFPGDCEYLEEARIDVTTR